MSKEEGVLDHVQRLCVRSADSREGWTDLLGRSHAHETQFDRQRGRRRLEVLDHLRVERRVWIPQDCDPGEPWDRLLEQLQPLGAELGHHDREPGDVSARMREACDQAGSDWIGDERP